MQCVVISYIICRSLSIKLLGLKFGSAFGELEAAAGRSLGGTERQVKATRLVQRRLPSHSHSYNNRHIS